MIRWWTFFELDVPTVQDFRVLVLTSSTLRDKSPSLLLLQGYVGLQKLDKREGIAWQGCVVWRAGDLQLVTEPVQMMVMCKCVLRLHMR